MTDAGRISRFALVGILVAALYVLLYLGFLAAGLPRWAANTLAFVLAIIAQYGGQAQFTFRKRLNDGGQLLRFGVMTGLGFVTSALITGVLAPAAALDDWVAAVAVTLILPVQNFILMTLWVFHTPST